MIPMLVDNIKTEDFKNLVESFKALYEIVNFLEEVDINFIPLKKGLFL